MDASPAASDAPSSPGPTTTFSTERGSLVAEFVRRIEGSTRLSLGVLIGLTLLLLVPFAGKAFNIDEPLFLKAAQHIAESPLDPYGFQLNWYDSEMPMWEVTKNPPLASYYIALVGSLFGWAEITLHLAFLLAAVGAVTGTFLLAQRFCRRAFLAGLAALATPVFLVSSTTVMCDTMMVAFWVWAVIFWLDGLDRNDILRFALAGMLIAASALTKYFGMSLIPLLALHALARKRRPGLWLLALAVPVLLLAWYQVWTRGLYGRGLLSDAASYAASFRKEERGLRLKTILVGLSFTGGCVLPALLYAPLLWRRLPPPAGVLSLMAFIVAVRLSWSGEMYHPFPPDGLVLARAHFALFLAGGLAIVALAVAALVEAWRKRDANTGLLGAWILGTFVFASFFNWTVNGRSVLPMVPAVAILLARCFDHAPVTTGVRPLARSYGPVLVSTTIALATAWADTRLANAVRATVDKIEHKMRGQVGTLWYEGHWGFQYYMEAIGGRHLVVDDTRMRSGDHFVFPLNNINTWPLWTERFASIEEIHAGGPILLTTMHKQLGAAFYASLLGPLPFSFGTPPEEGCVFIRLKTPAGVKELTWR